MIGPIATLPMLAGDSVEHLSMTLACAKVFDVRDGQVIEPNESVDTHSSTLRIDVSGS